MDAMKEFGEKPLIVGTRVFDDEQSFSWLCKLEAKICLLHAPIVDRRSRERILEHVDEIMDHGMLAGIATHFPHRTLKWFLNHFDNSKIKFVMAPLNYGEVFLDAPLPAIEELYETIMIRGYGMILKKALEAGG